MDYNTMKRFHLSSEGLVNYTGAKMCLEATQKIPIDDKEDFARHQRFYRTQSKWTLSFFRDINPLLWPVWFKFIYEDEIIPVFDLTFGQKLSWYSVNFSNVSEKLTVKKLAEYWGVEKPISKRQFLLEVKSLRVRELIFDKVAKFFALNNPQLNPFFNIYTSSPNFNDPSWVFWGFRSTKKFYLSSAENTEFEKFVWDLAEFLKDLHTWP